MLENKLNKIFRYYKKKYRLKTKLIFDEVDKNCFNRFSNEIHYNLYSDPILNASELMEEVTVYNFSEEFKLTKKETLILILLHEIKHAIDYTCFNKKWNKEINKIDFSLYYDDVKYYHKLPSEKRAYKFSRKELKRWKKC